MANWYLSQSLGIEAYDAGSNRTLYRTRVYVCANQYMAYSGYSTSGGGSVDGQGFEFGGPSALSLTNACAEVYTGTFWVYGDTNGYKPSIGASAWFNGGGGYAPGYITAGASAGGFDYDRRPAAPSFASIYRSIDDMYVGVNNTSSPAGTPTYYIERSQNGGGWGDQRIAQSTWYYDLPQGTNQQFRTLASNSDGSSGWTYSGTYSIPTVPSAPAAITVSAVNGLDVTVSISGSTSNGGSAITAYYMQYNNGSGWTGTTQVTGSSLIYMNLTPGLTYTFRVWSVNEMGNSAYATSTPVFLSAGGRRWTGTVFTPTTIAKRHDGTDWVPLTIGRRHDGTDWVNLQ